MVGFLIECAVALIGYWLGVMCLGTTLTYIFYIPPVMRKMELLGFIKNKRAIIQMYVFNVFTYIMITALGFGCAYFGARDFVILGIIFYIYGGVRYFIIRKTDNVAEDFVQINYSNLYDDRMIKFAKGDNNEEK